MRARWCRPYPPRILQVDAGRHEGVGEATRPQERKSPWGFFRGPSDLEEQQMTESSTEVEMSRTTTEGRATSNPAARSGVIERVRHEGIEHVLLWFTDLEGHLKSFAITPAELEDALDDGMGFDGSSITGFNAIEESDMVAIPDPDTFQLMPAGSHKVARMLCDVVTPDGKPYEGDPRYVLRRALERM
jgi:hypothetical protein